MKKLTEPIIALVLICNMAWAQEKNTAKKTLEVSGLKRIYYLHIPPSYDKEKPTPLVFVFHGGKGTGDGQEKFTGFSKLADEKGFIVVYPNGYNKNWADGREKTLLSARNEGIDDVAFVSAMLYSIGKDYNIDQKRIYATGISNGAIFSQYLAYKLADKIAAIAPVAGGIAAPIANDFKPSNPVSVLIIQGTDDPLVPYHGGTITLGQRKGGEIIDTDETIKLWIGIDGCNKEGVTKGLPDTDPDDGCKVIRTIWSGGKNGTAVVLLKVEGGGHTWPSGPQYLPKRIIGNVDRDIDATKVIWEFFSKHPKQ